MASQEKLKQLEDIFNYGGNDAFTFPMGRLLYSPYEILDFCYDYSAPNAVNTFYEKFTNPKNKNYDKRLELSCNGEIDSNKHFISEEGIKQFVKDYIEYIDLDRLTLLAYYNLDRSINNDKIKNDFFLKNSKDAQRISNAMFNKIRNLMTKYDKSNAHIYNFTSIEKSEDGLPHIWSLSTNNALGYEDKVNKFPYNNLDFDKFNKLLNLDDFRTLYDDPSLYIYYGEYARDLEINNKFTPEEKVHIIAHEKVFKNSLNPVKYSLMVGNALNNKINNEISKLNSDNIKEEEKNIIDDLKLYNKIIPNLTRGVTIELPNDSNYTADKFMNESLDICYKAADKIIEYDITKINDLLKQGIVSFTTLDKAMPKIENKARTVAIALAQNVLDPKLFESFCKYYELDNESIKELAFNDYLKVHNISPNRVKDYPLDDEQFSYLIPTSKRIDIACGLIKDMTRNPSSTISSNKLNELLNNSFIKDCDLKNAYIDNKLTTEDVETINSFIEDYDSTKLNGFEFSMDKLIHLFKYLNDDSISKTVLDNDIEYTDRPIIIDADDYELKRNYEFQKALYIEAWNKDSRVQDTLLNKLEYLALMPEIARLLYNENLIDINHLKDYADDIGVKIEDRMTSKMLENGEIRNDDLFAVINGTKYEDNPIILSQVYETGKLNLSDVLNKYLDGAISYDTLVKFSNGRDMSQVFDEKKYLNLFSKAIRVNKPEDIELFKKYNKAFTSLQETYDLKKIRKNEFKDIIKNIKEGNIAEYYEDELIDGNILNELINTLYENDLNNSLDKKSFKYVVNSIADLVKAQDLRLADCQTLFRDDDSSHVKRDLLEYILNNYDLTNDQKMNVLLGTYSTQDVALDKNSLENFQYILNNCFDEVKEKSSKNDGESAKREGEVDDKKKEQELMPFLDREQVFKALDPNMISKIIGPAIIYYSPKYDKFMFEQIYTTSKGVNSDLTSHATYIISSELEKAIRKELYEFDKDENIIDFNYDALINEYRNNNNRDMVDKVLHKGKSWSNRLNMKVTQGFDVPNTVIEKQTDERQNS